ncbi:MAG: thiamine-phosphate kinase [Parvularculaceae bacterium]
MTAESEFDIIREIFAPLAGDAPGAFGLNDDAALMDEAAYVVTNDMMIAGVHFLADDPLDLVARKLMRVNLSDLAAKGAKPVGYFLACAWPKKTRRADIELFAKGLEEDQRAFRCALLGGDTTAHRSTEGPLTLSATFMGAPARQGLIRRAGAVSGDDLYVTGTIGDAGLGLAALSGTETFPRQDKEALTTRYRLPAPRLALGGAIAGLASAALDVSDGLLADAGRLSDASQVKLTIEAGRIPLSTAASAWLEGRKNAKTAIAKLAGFGDDYEILFIAPPALRRSVEMAARASRTPVARIGSVSKGAGVALVGAEGEEIAVKRAGYDCFAR